MSHLHALRSGIESLLPRCTSPVPSSLPNPSHFRHISLSPLSGRFMDPIHRRILVPQCRFCETYEKLHADDSLTYNSEEIAYTLRDLFEKVNARSGVGYERAYTQTGREIKSLSELPDFLSTVMIGTAADLPPERSPKADQHPDHAPTLKLPKLNIHKALFFSREKQLTPRVPMMKSQCTQSPPPTLSHRSLKSSLKVRLQSLPKVASQDRISLPHTTAKPLPTEQLTPQLTVVNEKPHESVPDTPDVSQVLTALFQPKEIESLQKEYLHLRHFSIVEKLNESVQSSARLPENMQEFLSHVKSKVLGKSRFRTIFAMYLQGAVPILRGKSGNVFRAILQGLGSDNQSLSWSQWLLLNSLLIYNNAPESLEVHFVCKVTRTQMLSSQNNYMDILVLLTSLFQGEGQNQHFQVLFAQLKGLLDAKKMEADALERMCHSGELDYRRILQTLRTAAL